MLITNRILYAHVVDSGRKGEMTERLALLLQEMCKRHISNHATWSKSEYKDDLIANAVLQLTKSWRSFKPELSSNVLGFFLAVVNCSVVGMLNKEQREVSLRRDLLDIGPNESPS